MDARGVGQTEAWMALCEAELDHPSCGSWIWRVSAAGDQGRHLVKQGKECIVGPVGCSVAELLGEPCHQEE